MAIESVPVRSRRAILVGALGGIAAAAARALAGPGTAEATNGGSLTLGAVNADETGTGTNQATLPTRMYSTSNGLEIKSFATALTATSTNATSSSAIYGASTALNSSGMFGSGPFAGVLGNSTGTGYGVMGENSTGIGVYGVSSATGGQVAGVFGECDADTGQVAGVWGRAASPGGIGVFGETTNTADTENYGVFGVSRSELGRAVFGWAMDTIGGTGVWGQTNAGLGAGVRGYAWDSISHTGQYGTGVIGTSGSHAFPPPAAKADTGVYGYSAHNSSARGVWGQSGSGQGVRGQATSGAGLYGTATTGYALHTAGRVRLDQSAGQATIASGQSTVVVTPGIDLTATSAVVATLNGNAGGSTAVKRVAIDPTANTFTIVLTAAATASVTVAWIVLG